MEPLEKFYQLLLVSLAFVVGVLAITDLIAAQW